MAGADPQKKRELRLETRLARTDTSSRQEAAKAGLSGDGRAWPSRPRVVNPAASRRVLTSGGAAHCCNMEAKAAGSSSRCDMLAGA